MFRERSTLPTLRIELTRSRQDKLYKLSEKWGKSLKAAVNKIIDDFEEKPKTRRI